MVTHICRLMCWCHSWGVKRPSCQSNQQGSAWMASQICTGDDRCFMPKPFDTGWLETNGKRARSRFSRTITRPMSKMTAFGGVEDKLGAGEANFECSRTALAGSYR